MIDENAWWINEAVSLTNCWSWDPMWLMRLPGKQMKQCHSLAVSHGIQHDWWKCLANKWSSSSDSLAVSHGMQHDWWECLANKPWWSSVTYLLVFMEYNMIDQATWQTNEGVSLTCCCHGIQHYWSDCLVKKWSSVTYQLLVMWCNMIDVNAWQKNEAVPLTRCWSWDPTWLIKMSGKEMKQ